jgi:cation-transporting ATPase 13A1
VASKSIVSASLHRKLPRIYHFYGLPFLVLYPIWLYIYQYHYERLIVSEEYTFITLGGLITCHLLTFLSCQWNVTIRAILTCSQVIRSICM